jgi:hypothetical protein
VERSGAIGLRAMELLAPAGAAECRVAWSWNGSRLRDEISERGLNSLGALRFTPPATILYPCRGRFLLFPFFQLRTESSEDPLAPQTIPAQHLAPAHCSPVAAFTLGRTWIELQGGLGGAAGWLLHCWKGVFNRLR